MCTPTDISYILTIDGRVFYSGDHTKTWDSKPSYFKEFLLNNKSLRIKKIIPFGNICGGGGGGGTAFISDNDELYISGRANEFYFKNMTAEKNIISQIVIDNSAIRFKDYNFTDSTSIYFLDFKGNVHIFDNSVPNAFYIENNIIHIVKSAVIFQRVEIIELFCNEHNTKIMLLDINGCVWSKGYNLDGSLGITCNQEILCDFTQIEIDNVKTITMCGNTTYFLLHSGQVFRCGNGCFIPSLYYENILQNIVQICSSVICVMFLDSCGNIFVQGEVVDDDIKYLKPTKQYNLPLSDIPKTIWCGYGHYLLLTENNNLYAWGENYNNQLGLGRERNVIIYEPTQVLFSEEIGGITVLPVKKYNKSCRNVYTSTQFNESIKPIKPIEILTIKESIQKI